MGRWGVTMETSAIRTRHPFQFAVTRTNVEMLPPVHYLKKVSFSRVNVNMNYVISFTFDKGFLNSFSCPRETGYDFSWSF